MSLNSDKEIKEIEEIRCIFPLNGVITLKISKKKVVKYLVELCLITQEFNVEKATHILSHKAQNQYQRNIANVISTICQFTKDGFIEPREFNVFEVHSQICRYLKRKGFVQF